MAAVTRIRVTAVTHRGLIRAGNEDCLGWNGWSCAGGAPAPFRLDLDITRRTVIVVCDGMGGHAGGVEAGRMACELLTDPLAPETADPAADPATAIRALLQRVSDTLNDTAAARPELAGMGCTVAGLAIEPDGTALVFNVGDSRAYRREGRYLAQLTVDHRRPGSNRLVQALGGGRRLILTPDFFTCPLPAAPGILLCTDGLDDYAEPAAVEAAALTETGDPVPRLRDLALAAGGGDNVTIVGVETLTPAVGSGTAAGARHDRPTDSGVSR
ncbi:PP2C family serine/threonine-protein phosphatase [Nocardia sp. BMG111209]|uniref:PP2C family protein-serine/threonine phosphatase n=1 Tax=Nocardia sp. BMG111209 TaxID=1160137 RepID=UPI00035C2F86|nr:protein phosphatase 2C domain-containing protein [Nocardia sp. BMG111209]